MPPSFRPTWGSRTPHSTQVPLSFQQTGGSDIPQPTQVSPSFQQTGGFTPHLPHMYLHVRMIMWSRMEMILRKMERMISLMVTIFRGRMIRLRFILLTVDIIFGPLEIRKY